MKKKKSEFGKGFVYNLILFAKHFERDDYTPKNDSYRYHTWFNGASDHLYGLKIPKQWRKKKIGKLANELATLALSIGHGNRMMENSSRTRKDFEKVIEVTKEIGFLIDKELGLKPIRGDWE